MRKDVESRGFEITDTESEKELTRGKGLAGTMTYVSQVLSYIYTDTLENDYILIHL